MSHLHRPSSPSDLLESAPSAVNDDAPSKPDGEVEASPVNTTRGVFDARFALAATFGLWGVLIGLFAALVFLVR